MTRSKLSGPEKQEIAVLYEHQQESIISLAERYQVSSSTIRRLLKNLPKPSQTKHSESVDPDHSATPEDESVESAGLEYDSLEPESAESAEVSEPAPPILASSKPKPIPKSKVNADAPLEAAEAQPSISQSASQSELQIVRGLQLDADSAAVTQFDDSPGQEQDSPSEAVDSPRPVRRVRLPRKSEEPKPSSADFQEPEESDSEIQIQRGGSTPHSSSDDELSEILLDLGQSSNRSFAEAESEDDEDEDDDEDDFEGLEDDGDDDDDGGFLSGSDLQLKSESLVEVMPFADAVLPKTCYLVIDRTAELVTRPLKDFGELGQIPEAETQARTLPIFDNHRIARRFSHRNQRIIKVPDADMLKKTSLQLSAKGITRLLVNGHIYSL